MAKKDVVTEGRTVKISEAKRLVRRAMKAKRPVFMLSLIHI